MTMMIHTFTVSQVKIFYVARIGQSRLGRKRGIRM